MKIRILALLLSLALLASCAFAEEAPVQAADEPAAAPITLDLSDTPIIPLPMDDYTAHGFVPNPEAFDGDTYADASLQVTMERIWVGDACFNVARVKIAHPSQLRTALAGKLGKKTNYVWNIAANHQAVVAIGGEDLAENNRTYTVRMGKTERSVGYAGRDTLIIDQNGDFHILFGYSNQARQALEEEGIQVINLFNFGPALVVDGQAQTLNPKYQIGNVTGVEPRTAIGQVGPLEYLLVVVDGRDKKAPLPDGTLKPSKGATMQAVADFMQEQGCIQAYALDGGGSAVMYFGGENYSNPSSKRGVSDIVYFATAVDCGLTEGD